MDEGEARKPRAPIIGPEVHEAQIQARVAWYYYVGGMTQQEIVDRLKLTRLRVNRMVGQVRSDGLLRIEVKLALADCVALEERLKARYSLDDATVVSSVSDSETQQEMIGEAAGAIRPGRDVEAWAVESLHTWAASGEAGGPFRYAI